MHFGLGQISDGNGEDDGGETPDFVTPGFPNCDQGILERTGSVTHNCEQFEYQECAGHGIEDLGTGSAGQGTKTTGVDTK
jgi:hypothetical protein